MKSLPVLLVERYGGGRLIPPAGTPERLRYTYWLHAAEGSIAAMLVMKLVFRRTTEAPVPFFLRPITRAVASQVEQGYFGPALAAQMKLMEDTLAESTWFAGEEFTAADVQMSFPVEAAATRVDLGTGHPRLHAFLERIHARPAYRRALERGGPYQLL